MTLLAVGFWGPSASWTCPSPFSASMPSLRKQGWLGALHLTLKSPVILACFLCPTVTASLRVRSEYRHPERRLRRRRSWRSQLGGQAHPTLTQASCDGFFCTCPLGLRKTEDHPSQRVLLLPGLAGKRGWDSVILGDFLPCCPSPRMGERTTMPGILNKIFIT